MAISARHKHTDSCFSRVPETEGKGEYLACGKVAGGGGKDSCQVCHGERGGVPGNENLVDGVVMCDYCHAESLREGSWS